MTWEEMEQKEDVLKRLSKEEMLRRAKEISKELIRKNREVYEALADK